MIDDEVEEGESEEEGEGDSDGEQQADGSRRNAESTFTVQAWLAEWQGSCGGHVPCISTSALSHGFPVRAGDDSDEDGLRGSQEDSDSQGGALHQGAC